MKVFLGGTCNDSRWRADLIRNLYIDYFNPVVDDWDKEAQEREIAEQETRDYCLYVITPRMTGVYAIAEAVDDSNKRPKKTLFCWLNEDGELGFNAGQSRSLEQVGQMVERNGARHFYSLSSIARFLNQAQEVT